MSLLRQRGETQKMKRRGEERGEVEKSWDNEGYKYVELSVSWTNRGY